MEKRVYCYPNRQKRITKDGETRYYPSISTTAYTCKLHYPDAEEIVQIRAELAAGETKKSVAIKHNLGAGIFRLNRLLEKNPAPIIAPDQPYVEPREP